jgi:hypothetical protein
MLVAEQQLAGEDRKWGKVAIRFTSESIDRHNRQPFLVLLIPLHCAGAVHLLKLYRRRRLFNSPVQVDGFDWVQEERCQEADWASAQTASALERPVTGVRDAFVVQMRHTCPAHRYSLLSHQTM